MWPRNSCPAFIRHPYEVDQWVSHCTGSIHEITLRPLIEAYNAPEMLHNCVGLRFFIDDEIGFLDNFHLEISD